MRNVTGVPSGGTTKGNDMTLLRPLMAGLMITTAGAAFAEQVSVSAVEVDAELSNVSNEKALDYYPDIKADLQAAIAEELFALAAEDGHTVKVRISEISLDGQPLQDDKGFNTLDGWVYVYPPESDQQAVDSNATKPEPLSEFNIKLNATTVGAGILPGTDDYYNAMIEAFAQSTGEQVMAVEAKAN